MTEVLVATPVTIGVVLVGVVRMTLGALIGLVVDPELLLPEPPPHAANKQANVATTI